MSSPILPIDGPRGLSSSTSIARDTGDEIATFMSELSASERALAIGAGRGGPPPEVLDQITAASRINEQLRESGYELCFSTSEKGARVKIELRDSQGNTVRTVSAAEAIEIAAGKPLQ